MGQCVVLIVVSLLVLQVPISRPHVAAASAQAGGAAVEARQGQRSQDGAISGTVVDAGTGLPVAGASIDALLGSSLSGRRVVPTVTTDQTGAFSVRDLPDGTYSVRASLAGYVDGYPGTQRHDDRRATTRLRNGNDVEDLRITMWRTGAIEGQVLDDLGRPIAGAIVEVRPWAGRGHGGRFSLPHRTAADDAGRYRFEDLRPADYLAAVLFTPVSIPASVLTAFDQAMLNPTADGNELIARVKANRVPLPRGPASDVRGFDVVGPEGPAPSPSGMSPDGRALVYQTTFYPDALTVAGASPVRVESGQVRFATTFRLPVRPTVRVSGVLRGPADSVAHVALRLVAPPDPLAEANEFISLTTFENAMTVTDGRGGFTFPAVPAGRYRLATQPAGRTPWAHADIEVGTSDVDGLVVDLRPGIQVRGQVIFDGDRPAPAGMVAQAVVRLGELVPSGYAGPPAAHPDVDGHFVTPGHEPGRYLVLNLPVGGWWLQSAMLDGRDVSRVPIELADENVSGLVLTYTRSRTQLSATLASGAGPGPHAVEVVVFPANYEAWFAEGLPTHLPQRDLRILHADADGLFQVVGMAPGDYLVAAYPCREGADLSAGSLSSLAALATRVVLREGEPAEVEVRLHAPPTMRE